MVEGKNNKQKNRTKYFLPGGKKQIQAVFYLELSSHRTADIISEETGAKPLLLHSCHNVTRRQFDEGVTYLQLMKQNAKNLREALL